MRIFQGYTGCVCVCVCMCVQLQNDASDLALCCPKSLVLKHTLLSAFTHFGLPPAEMPFAHSFFWHFFRLTFRQQMWVLCALLAATPPSVRTAAEMPFAHSFFWHYLISCVGTVFCTCCYPTFSAYGCRNALCKLIFLALFDQLCGYCALHLLLSHLQCVRLQKCPLLTHFVGTF